MYISTQRLFAVLEHIDVVGIRRIVEVGGVAVAIVLFILLEPSSVVGAPFFFRLCAGCAGGDGGDSGGGDGGDSGGGDCGGCGGGDSSAGESGGAGCGSEGGCGSCSGCSGSGDGGSCSYSSGTSTPFLSVWNGERYVLENDVMIGSPRTMFSDIEAGKKAYEENTVAADMYKIQTPVVASVDGNVQFQIKEMEPEESYIDSLQYEKVVYDKAGELVVNAEHSTFHVFDREEMLRGRGILHVSATHVQEGKPFDHIIGRKDIFSNQVHSEDKLLEAGDSVIVNARVDVSLLEKRQSVFMLIGSHYRDWIAGSIELLEHEERELRKSPYTEQLGFSKALNGRVRAALLPLLMLATWFGLGSVKRDGHDDLNILANALGTPTAHADFVPPPSCGYSSASCDSLEVEYFDWNVGTYALHKVLSPRNIHTSLDNLELPASGINTQGEVRVRITATKRHNLSSVSFFVPTKEYTAERIPFSLVRAHHSRTGTNMVRTLTSQRNGEYVHLIPGDVLDIQFAPQSFAASDPERNKISNLITVGGVYTPLTVSGRILAGDWVSKLSSDDKARLLNMYPLTQYPRTLQKV